MLQSDHSLFFAMSTFCKSATFEGGSKRTRYGPARQSALSLDIIRRIAELELDRLNIIRDDHLAASAICHFYLDLDTAGCQNTYDWDKYAYNGSRGVSFETLWRCSTFSLRSTYDQSVLSTPGCAGESGRTLNLEYSVVIK